jgi:hypothetical protein
VPRTHEELKPCRASQLEGVSDTTPYWVTPYGATACGAAPDWAALYWAELCGPMLYWASLGWPILDSAYFSAATGIIATGCGALSVNDVASEHRNPRVPHPSPKDPYGRCFRNADQTAGGLPGVLH